MSTNFTMLISLFIISSLVCVIQPQEPTTTTSLTTEEFTSNTSKYVVILSDVAFHWFAGHDICLRNGYIMSQINNTEQNQQIADIMLSSDKIAASGCWLGAFGFFISNAWWWTWDAFDGSIEWNETLASQLIITPSFAVDITRTQGLTINVTDNNNAIWSYSNADSSQLCVVCLDINLTSNASTTSLAPSAAPTIAPIATPTTIVPTLITASIPTLIPSISPSINPSSVASTAPVSTQPSVTLNPTSNPSFNPTVTPSTAPSLNPTNTPSSSNPSIPPSNTPTIAPTTRRPTYNWDDIDENTGEINLDQMVNQSCVWRDLECAHCLERLRIAIISTEQHMDQLLEQYNEHDHCQCFGGFGIERITENNKTVLTVHASNTSITFEEREDGDQASDDITVSITNWRGEYNKCELEFYVNRHSFLGIKARNILKVEFDITGIKDIDAYTTNAHESKYNLGYLLRDYFSNDSVAEDEANNVSVHIYNDETRRRLIEDDDLSVSVLIFTDSGEYARRAKSDLEASMHLSSGWDENIEDIIHNQTGDVTNLSNIKYSLLSADQLDDDIVIEIPDEDSEESAEQIPTKLVIKGTLLVVIIFSSILVSILIITYVVYSFCKDKHRMAYQKPEVTRDNISDLQETSACEGDCEEEEGENEPMLHTGYAFNGGNVSHRVDLNLNVSHRVKRGQLHALDDEQEAAEEDNDLVLYPGGKTPLDAKTCLGTVTTDELQSEIAETASSFSAKTSVINFDLESNLDLNELVPSMVHKVCNSHYTQLIQHDELTMEHIIGRGHYGEVYVGTYDGNKVAIKTFKDAQLDLLIRKNKKENNDNEDIKAFNEDMEYSNAAVKKARYARTKEIYSEVVLASSLPSHPNLVQIIGITQSPLTIVMTYYDGGNLRDFIYNNRRKYGPITMNSIVNLMQKIADAILFLHNNKIVHRDIAARNVLLGHIEPDGQIRDKTRVVVSDFGMTRCMSMQWIDEQQTKQKIGAIKWMAPESIMKQKYSYKSDVYMFGMTMFEVMHAKEPYTSPTYQNLTLPILAIKIAKKAQRPIINETEELETILVSNDLNHFVIQKINKLIRNCWDKSPLNRPNMLTILHELNSIYDSMIGL